MEQHVIQILQQHTAVNELQRHHEQLPIVALRNKNNISVTGSMPQNIEKICRRLRGLFWGLEEN